MLFCLGCHTIYDNLKYNEELSYQICPIDGCYGKVIETDELITPTIMLLNKKGYYTDYCCSGHWYDSSCNIYISFDCDIKLPFYPECFNVEHNENRVVLRKMLTDKKYSIQSKINLIYKCNKILYRWAKNLPKNL